MNFLSRVKKYLKFEFFALALFFGGLFFVPILYIPQMSSNLHLPKEIFFYCIIGGILLFSFLSLLQKKTTRIHRTFIDIPLVSLFVCAVLSTIFSLSFSKSLWGQNDTFSLHLFGLLLFLIWSWYILQTINTQQYLRSTMRTLLLSGVVAQIYFWINDLTLFRKFIHFDLINPVDSFNSIFGIFVAVILVLSISELLPKGKNYLASQVFSFMTALLSFATLLRLNITFAWVLLAFGVGALFLLGILLFSSIRKITHAGIFLVFVFSLVVSLTNSLSFVSKKLPAEISLSPRLSWNIVEESFFSGTKQFLFGVGPSNFVYTFSQFRPAILNTDSFFWSLRFDSPHNSVFLWMTEFGFLGTVNFLLIILIVFGCILSIFLHIRENLRQKVQSFLFEKAVLQDPSIIYLVFLIVFCMLTLGLFLSVYHFSLWFLWWTFLALSILVMSRIQPTLMRYKDHTFSIAPHHLFVISFVFLLFVCLWVTGGVVYGKKLFAEYTLSSVSSPAFQEQALLEAIAYDPDSSDYHLLLSKYYLQQALQSSDMSSGTKVRALSLSLEEAVIAKDLDPNNVAVWEVLSTGYMNSLSLTPSAFRYAVDSVEMSKRLEPSNPIFYSQFGFLSEWNKEFDLAEKNYQTALLLKPDYLQAVFDLSNLYENQNMFEKAIAVYTKALVVTKEPSLYFELGRMYFNKRAPGDDEKALEAWRKALELKPDYSDVLYSLGLLAERKGEKSIARKYFEQVKKLNPKNEDIDKKLKSLE